MADPIVDISGLDKAAVLATLYNRAGSPRPGSAAALHYTPMPMSIEQSRAIIEEDLAKYDSGIHYDCLHGRCLKINITGDTMDSWLYDREYGEGAAQRAINELRGGYTSNPYQRMRRNPDFNIRQLERAFSASGSPELMERLLIAYQRVGRELDYLSLLDKDGPGLIEHERWVVGDNGYGKRFYPRLTPEQEQRFQQLMWQSFVTRAQQADQTGTIDFDLLLEAESFVDRRVHNKWDYNILADTTKPSGKRKRRPSDGTVAKHLYKNTDDIHWYNEDPADGVLAKIYCRRDDEGVDLMSKAAYIAYWKEYPALPLDPWENAGATRSLVTEPELGYVGAGNLTGIGFLFDHRTCAYDHQDDIDPSLRFDIPPDTPSLPPMGSADPNWRRNPR